MIPYMYDYINTAESTLNPSGIQCNPGIKRYFARYLMQKIISVFEWNLPEEWEKNFFQYVLYTLGFVCVIDTEKFGVIPQNATLGGYGIYYEPTKAIITNPSLPGIHEKRIGIDCEIVRMQPDYGGARDIVDLYATMMACIVEGISTNIFNTKLAYVYACENDKQAQSFKKMFDQINTGRPAVFIDKDLFDEDGKPRWLPFAQKLKETYIAPEMLADLATIENRFYTTIGINNGNTDKKERLIVDEVNANNVQITALASVWLENMRTGAERVNAMFGTDLSVTMRTSPVNGLTSDETKEAV